MRTGHLAMSQIVVAVLPMPIGPATALTIGPVRTIPSAITASRITSTRVTRI
jgi:hypothetical protein